MAKIIETIKNEFQSYSKKIQITLALLIGTTIIFGIFAVQILFWGLGYTDMNNVFTWGAWIFGDLSLVVLGGGAFFTGFLLYIFRVDKLEPIINSAVLIGLLCYAFTLVFLLFDVGQPLRAWFGFAYPNWGDHLMPTSMLTEVFFCLSIYFCILIVEFIPIALKHKVLDKNPIIHAIGHYMHKLMWIMAAAGTFLSLFHQGSLGGGMWGVLYGKPAYFRPHFFFLAIVAATAAGPSFIILCSWIAGKVMKKEVVPLTTFQTLARFSGFMMIIFYLFRIYDIYKLQTFYVPLADRNYLDLWGGYYGIWMLVAELILLFIPIILLNLKYFREKETYLIIGTSSAVAGMVMNKLHTLLHGFSVPNFPWKNFVAYMPTIQEVFITIGGFSCMILIYMWCAKYLPLFPHLAKHENNKPENRD